MPLLNNKVGVNNATRAMMYCAIVTNVDAAMAIQDLSYLSIWIAIWIVIQLDLRLGSRWWWLQESLQLQLQAGCCLMLTAWIDQCDLSVTSISMLGLGLSAQCGVAGPCAMRNLARDICPRQATPLRKSGGRVELQQFQSYCQVSQLS